jgi:general nucleoside transport system ATP-binding protein
VTVLRRGSAVRRYTRAEFDKSKLIAAMVDKVPEKAPIRRSEPGEVVVEIEDVNVISTRQRRGLDGASLTVRRREIVGVAGVVGNGQEALAELLRGLAAPSKKKILHLPPCVAFIPEDRARDGLAMSLSIADNMMVYRHRDPAFKVGTRLSASSVGRFVDRALKQGGVRAPQGIGAPASSLSGGNQQKIVIAREFDRSPDLIVAHNPYRGLDVGAADAVRQSLIQARDSGAAVVLISPDLDDLFDVATRIVFLSNGRITGSVDPQSTTAMAVGALLGGDVL